MYCWSLVHLGADGVNWRYLSLKQFIRIRKVRILSCSRLIWMTSEENGRKMLNMIIYRGRLFLI